LVTIPVIDSDAAPLFLECVLTELSDYTFYSQRSATIGKSELGCAGSMPSECFGPV